MKYLKKYKLKEIRIDMGIFDFTCVVIIGSYDSAAKYCASIFESNEFEVFAHESNGGYIPRGKTFFRTGYVPVVWIPGQPRSAREYATLAHEAVHVLVHLFEWAGMNMNSETEEVFAHALAYIVATTLQELKK